MVVKAFAQIGLVIVALLCGCAGPQSLSELFAEETKPLEKIAPPPGLTRDEAEFWSILSPQKQREALEFLKNGGTMASLMRV